jgi:hypothetical protein
MGEGEEKRSGERIKRRSGAEPRTFSREMLASP